MSLLTTFSETRVPHPLSSAGVRMKSWTPGAPGREARMLAFEEGVTQAEAVELAGTTRKTVGQWAARRLPRSCAGRPWGSGKMGGTSGERKAAHMFTRGLYDPPTTGPLAGLVPAQIENLLLGAVLAGPKAGGWDPAPISNRSKCDFSERLRRGTGLPLRSITGFLRMSRSSHECHRARRGRDRGAGIRTQVAEEFTEELSAHIACYREGRLKAFDEGGRTL